MRRKFKIELSRYSSNLIVQLGIALVSILGIFSLRLPFRLTEGFLWGEDATIFIKQAYEIGFSSFFSPYAGYLHSTPRLVSYVIGQFASIPATPYAYVFACLVIYALCAVYLLRVALRFSGDWTFSVAAAATPFIVASSGEIYLTITNLQWITAPVLLVLVWDTYTVGGRDQRRPLTWAIRLFILFLLITTGPFAILFLPVTVIVLWINRGRLSDGYAISALATCGVAILIQVTAMYFAPPVLPMPNTSHDWSHFSWIDQFARSFADEMFMPANVIDRLGRTWEVAGIALIALTFGLGLASNQRVVCLVLLGMGSLSWAVGVYRVNTPDIPIHWYGFGARYLFIPYVLVSWALLIIANTTRPAIRWVPILLLIATLWTSFDQFEGSHWEKWQIDELGHGTFKMKVAPGIEKIVRQD